VTGKVVEDNARAALEDPDDETNDQMIFRRDESGSGRRQVVDELTFVLKVTGPSSG